MNQELTWYVELSVRPGQLDALRALTREMVASTRAEPGALIYERHLTSDGATMFVHERYATSEAAVAHLRTFAERFDARFGPLVERRRFVVFGDPSPEARAILDRFSPTYAAPMDGFSRPAAAASGE